jgi:hypothetical protein
MDGQRRHYRRSGESLNRLPVGPYELILGDAG